MLARERVQALELEARVASVPELVLVLEQVLEAWVPVPVPVPVPVLVLVVWEPVLGPVPVRAPGPELEPELGVSALEPVRVPERVRVRVQVRVQVRVAVAVARRRRLIESWALVPS